MRLDSFFSGALCALSGGRLPEALFMVFLLDSKGAKVCKCKSCISVNLVDLVKSLQTSIYYLLAKFGVDTLLFENRTTSDSDSDTAENEPLRVSQKKANSY